MKATDRYLSPMQEDDGRDKTRSIIPFAADIPQNLSPDLLPLRRWGEVFRHAASESKPVEFQMNLGKDLYRALVTEATEQGICIFTIAETMLRLGFERFADEGLVWNDPTTPGNVLRFPTQLASATR